MNNILIVCSILYLFIGILFGLGRAVSIKSLDRNAQVVLVFILTVAFWPFVIGILSEKINNFMDDNDNRY